MIKYLVLIMVAGHLGAAQKSFYASNQSWYPKVLAKYKTTTTTTTPTPTTTTTMTMTQASTSDGLAVKAGQETAFAQAEFSPPQRVFAQAEFSPPPPEQGEVFGTRDFIERVSSWPRERQPFWYKNRQAISSMINQNVDGGLRQQPRNRINSNFISPFAGQRSWAF